MTANTIRPLSSPEMVEYREQQQNADIAADFVGSRSDDSNIEYFYNHDDDDDDDSSSSQSSKILPPPPPPPSEENCKTINKNNNNNNNINIKTTTAPCNNKCVRFAPTCTLKHMLSHRDMTTKEKQNTWIQKEEARSIIQKCRNLIDIIDKVGGMTNEYDDSSRGRKERICTRGLESGMRLESLRKQACRLKGIETVFIAQQQQEVECSSSSTAGVGYYYKYDDEAIAAVYRSVTNDCRIRAERVGLHDRKQVVRYYLKDVD